MFQMTKEDVLNTIKNYSILMSRVREVVDEIGFLDKEFDTLDINKTNFTVIFFTGRLSYLITEMKVKC